MLEFTSYSAGLAAGVYKFPVNVTVIGRNAVRETETGVSGALIRNNSTGLYSLFSCGFLHGVDQREAKRLETEFNEFVSVSSDGALCDEKYCPYAAGHTGRIGPCEGDFCEEAWDNFCEHKE